MEECLYHQEVDEERTRPGHLLGLVLYLPFSALMVGWQERHPAHKRPGSTNLQRFTGTGGAGEGR